MPLTCSIDKVNSQGSPTTHLSTFLRELTLLNDLAVFPNTSCCFNALDFHLSCFFCLECLNHPSPPCLVSWVNINSSFRTQLMCHLHLPGGIALAFLLAPTVLSTDSYQPTDNLLLHYKSQQIHTILPPL